MPFFKAFVNVSVVCVTWLVVRRLLGETTSTARDGAALVVAGIATVLATVWADRRNSGAAE